MDLALPWPVSQGEWLAWSSAVATVAIGLVFLFAPRIALRASGIDAVERAQGLALARASVAGFQIGLGLCAVLLAQPLIHLTLGFAWTFALFGRVISILSDNGNSLRNWAWAVVELVLAALPLAFAFGLVS